MSGFWQKIEAENDLKHGPGKWHCDDIWRLKSAPDCVLAFLDVARAPAHGGDKTAPALYAKYQGVPCRVTMASRFGDVGISLDLDRPTGYDKRLFLCELSDFGAAK